MVRGGVHVALGHVVGLGEHDDVYAMVSGKRVDLNTTLAVGGITPNCTVYICARMRIGSRENAPGQWTKSNCFAECCWLVRTRCYRCGEPTGTALLPWKGKGKGKEKGDHVHGPLGRKPLAPAGIVPRTVNEKKPQVPPRGPPGAGVGSPPAPETPPSEDMIKALKLLQSVMSADSKNEKLVVPPPKEKERVKLGEQELFEKVQKEKEQMHLEQIKKHEHNLQQQKVMLEDVLTRLEAVKDEVKALRALLSERKEPEVPQFASRCQPRKSPHLMRAVVPVLNETCSVWIWWLRRLILIRIWKRRKPIPGRKFCPIRGKGKSL